MHTRVYGSTTHNKKLNPEAASVSISRGMKKQIWTIHTMEYYSAIQKDKRLICRKMEAPYKYSEINLAHELK